MIVKFKTEEFKKVLSQLGAVVSKKASVPVFGYVRLFTFQNGDKLAVALVGVDVEASLTRTIVSAEPEGPTDVLIQFSKLVEIVANVETAECSLDIDGETKVKFIAGKFRAELKTHPLANWPGIMERPDRALATIALPAFKEQIGQVEFAVPASDGKHIVAVAKLESNGTALTLVGTDGFRLAIAATVQNAGEFSLTLPKPALDFIKKLEGGTQLTISEADAGFYFDTELETLTVASTHGQFPPYRTVIPPKFATQITVKKKAFLSALKRVKPLADPEKPVIVFSVAEGATVMGIWAAHVESGSDGVGFRNMAQDELDVVTVGPETEFTLDAALLQPFLESAYGSGDGDITIRRDLPNEKKPNPIVDFNAGENYRFLQMPTQPASHT